MNVKKKKEIYRSIGSLGIKILDPLVKKRASFHLELFKNWHHIVNKTISSICYPYQLKWEKKNKKIETQASNEKAYLILYCDSVFITEILHQKIEIIESVNNFFNDCFIQDLRFIQRPHWDKKNFKKVNKFSYNPILSFHNEKLLKDKIIDIDDANLKRALFEFGKAVYDNDRT